MTNQNEILTSYTIKLPTILIDMLDKQDNSRSGAIKQILFDFFKNYQVKKSRFSREQLKPRDYCTVFLPTEIVHKLNDVADTLGYSNGPIIRTILLKYLEEQLENNNNNEVGNHE